MVVPLEIQLAESSADRLAGQLVDWTVERTAETTADRSGYLSAVATVGLSVVYSAPR